MRCVTLGRASSVLVVALMSPLPAQADDQPLQTVLQRLQCVPSKIAPTELASGIVLYEVTCRRQTDVLRILCQGTDCREQLGTRDDEERGGEKQ